MGEKGNISSDELMAAGSGAVIAASGTQVTAIFEEAADTLKDKVIDKGADASIAVATDKWQQRKSDPGPSEPPAAN